MEEIRNSAGKLKGVSKSDSEVVCTKLYEAPCGTLIIGTLGEKLCLCDWAYSRHRIAVDRRLALRLRTVYREYETPSNTMASKQLDEYFRGERRIFTMPLLFIGTDFQKKVWETLLNIPYGQTYSYSSIAEQLGKPKAVRAVANACQANAIAIFAPCHRVVATDGTLAGYAGGISAKNFLLNMEACKIKG